MRSYIGKVLSTLGFVLLTACGPEVVTRHNVTRSYKSEFNFPKSVVYVSTENGRQTRYYDFLDASDRYDGFVDARCVIFPKEKITEVANTRCTVVVNNPVTREISLQRGFEIAIRGSIESTVIQNELKGVIDRFNGAM